MSGVSTEEEAALVGCNGTRNTLGKMGHLGTGEVGVGGSGVETDEIRIPNPWSGASYGRVPC